MPAYYPLAPSLRAPARLALSVATAAAFAQVLPAATWLPPVRRCTPGLAGVGRPGHVALTFDDGPDPDRTPAVLDVLAAHGVRASFFVLGERVRRHPHLTRRIVAAGHELGLHGWRHGYALWHSPQLGRCLPLLEDVAGVRPRWFRPPYGVLSATAWIECRRAGLRPVLWTQWAKDWRPDAYADSVLARLAPGIEGGATLLLHDGAEGTAAGTRGRAVVDALPAILRLCADRGLSVGPLAEHFEDGSASVTGGR